jgi:single-stranded-DNA-specific exonuclease
MLLFDRILVSRGIDDANRASFLLPNYSELAHDPFLLPDMNKAVDRLVKAFKNQDKITIYGDYDIDGLTSTTLLFDALKSFGFKNISTYIPSRFDEGYGLTINSIEKIASSGTKLIVTVDCGSRSEKEIIKANEIGIDVIVTDHHNVVSIQPPAVAVVNPKRPDHQYPFCDLAGVGVTFKLVQALQIRFNVSPSASSGLPHGQEKWLLDLVAFGTVCDVVPLTDENRAYVFWGLNVLKKTRRLGLKALIAVSNLETDKINSRSLGFVLGPRMNAAGRLETAGCALELLTAESSEIAFNKAQYLDELNSKRRSEQDKIFKEASAQVESRPDDPVIVVSNKGWNHGIVGIVASKLLEKYHKPALVLQELEDISKGSARSFGDFNIARAIEACKSLIKSGGGHSLAAGVTLPTENIEAFRKAINELYLKLNLTNQESALLPRVDAIADLSEINEELAAQIEQLEPFGYGNSRPVIQTNELTVCKVFKMGNNQQHLKLQLSDKNGQKMTFLAFNAPKNYFVNPGSQVSVRYEIELNDWNGLRSVEGRLLHLEVND